MSSTRHALAFHLACLGVPGLLSACAASPQAASNLAVAFPGSALSESLIGATPTLLSAEFGQPAILRVDGPAQVWLYHDASCGLNLILYPDASGIPRVAMATATGGNAAPTACTASLQQAHLDQGLMLPATATLLSPMDAALEHPGAS